MSDTQPPQAADYLVDASGSIQINDAGSGVVRAFRDAEHAYDELQLAWAGARLACLFVQHPWLQSVKITLTATAEYNDEGGSYRSVSNAVEEVVPAPGVALPDAVLSDGAFDDERAAELIEEDIDEVDIDLYTSIRPEYDDFSEIVLAPSRRILDPGPTGRPISGAQAYRAWLAASAGTAPGE